MLCPQWPGVQVATDPSNAELSLLGGAAFQRVLAEFHVAIMALGFPGGAHMHASAWYRMVSYPHEQVMQAACPQALEEPQWGEQ